MEVCYLSTKRIAITWIGMGGQFDLKLSRSNHGLVTKIHAAPDESILGWTWLQEIFFFFLVIG